MIRRRALLSLIEYKQIEPSIPNNEIWYTSSDGNVVTPYNTNDFGVNIISNEYNNGKGVITFDGDVTTIGNEAFEQCRSLTSITIPNSVTTIGQSTFSNCSKLVSVTIPESLTTIAHHAFYGCANMTSVTIPDSVTSIRDYAFRYCYSLTSVYCKVTTPPSLGESVFDDNGVGRKIYVPVESVEAYKSASGWSVYVDAIVGYDFEEDGEESGNLIAFTVDGVEYQAEEGMTWGEWVDSEYNTGNFIIKNNFIYTTDNKIVNDDNTVHEMSSDEKVISGGVYYITLPEPE